MEFIYLFNIPCSFFRTMQKHWQTVRNKKRAKWFKIKGCAELYSAEVRLCKSVIHANDWSITIIRIMCSLQMTSWTSFVMKIHMDLLIAFILKCVFSYWRCYESSGYISKSDPPVLIWALWSLFFLNHLLFHGTRTHEYTYSIMGTHKHTNMCIMILACSKWGMKCPQIMRWGHFYWA